MSFPNVPLNKYVASIANTFVQFPDVFNYLTDQSSYSNQLNSFKTYGLNLLKIAIYLGILIVILIIFAIFFCFKKSLKLKNPRKSALLLSLLVLLQIGVILIGALGIYYSYKSKNNLVKDTTALENIKDKLLESLKNIPYIINERQKDVDKKLNEMVFHL